MRLRRPTSIAFRVLLASTLLAIVISAALAALLVSISSRRHASDEEAHARDTLPAARGRQPATGGLEPGRRGSLLTKNRLFRQPWETALKQMPPAEQRL